MPERNATERHQRGDVDGPRDFRNLRQECDASSSLVRCQRGERCLIEIDGATRRAQQADHAAEQRRLACAIRTEHCRHAAGGELHGDGVEDAASAAFECQLDSTQSGIDLHVTCLRIEYSKAKKNGAPIRDITTPSCTSEPPGSSRTTTSPASTSAAPPAALGTSRDEGFAPMSGRNRCGTTSPTKPMMPDTATLAPTTSPTPPANSHCARPRSIPSERAPISPSVRASSACREVRISAAPTAMSGVEMTRSSRLRSASAPSSQRTISPAAHGLGDNDRTSAMPATAIALRITPESTNVSVLAATPASRNSATMPTIAPATPLSGKIQGCRSAMPRKMLNTAPNPAIEETPSVPGSASGLRR